MNVVHFQFNKITTFSMSYMSDEISGGSVSFMLGEEKLPKPSAYPLRLIQLPLTPLNTSGIHSGLNDP